MHVTTVRRAPLPTTGGELEGARILARGLEFPEGPVALGDGSVVLGEVKAGVITRVDPSGSTERIIRTGGGPNGLAVGPDGALYVCNNGDEAGVYSGGRIERVDLATGVVEVLYEAHEGRRLSAPNDIVFDKHGGFYFTEYGAVRPTGQDRGALFYAKADGSSISKVEDRRFLRPGIAAPNGIGMSADGSELYFVETFTARLFSLRIAAPGVVDEEQSLDESFVYGSSALEWFDGLAVDVAGNICVATLRTGTITVCAPTGEAAHQVHVPAALWDPLATNLCFGGPDRRTLFLTLSTTGTLMSAPWPRAGIPLAFELESVPAGRQ
jgi:gluconolactonase